MNLDALIKREPGEKMALFLRRHIIVLLAEMLLIAVLAAVPVAGYFVIGWLWPALLAGPMARPILVLLASAYYLWLWLFTLTTFIDYYLDAWIVTTTRILNVEQHGLFSRTMSELDLSKVQDVTSEEKGVLAFIFNYGTVYVQTAGETERFIFEQVHRPHEIRKQILALMEEDQKQHASQKAK